MLQLSLVESCHVLPGFPSMANSKVVRTITNVSEFHRYQLGCDAKQADGVDVGERLIFPKQMIIDQVSDNKVVAI